MPLVPQGGRSDEGVRPAQFEEGKESPNQQRIAQGDGVEQASLPSEPETLASDTPLRASLVAARVPTFPGVGSCTR